MEDDLWWKTTFDGGQPSIEDDHQLKRSFGGRRNSIEDKLRWKTTFDGRWPTMEDDRQWKTTFNWRRPLLEDDLQQDDSSPSQSQHKWPQPEILSAVLTGNRIPRDWKKCTWHWALSMCTKDDFRQRLNCSEVGDGIFWDSKLHCNVEPNSCLQVQVYFEVPENDTHFLIPLW